MIILGLGGLNTDPACAVLKDGELVAAVEERKVARQATADALPQADCGRPIDHSGNGMASATLFGETTGEIRGRFGRCCEYRYLLQLAGVIPFLWGGDKTTKRIRDLAAFSRIGRK